MKFIPYIVLFLAGWGGFYLWGDKQSVSTPPAATSTERFETEWQTLAFRTGEAPDFYQKLSSGKIKHQDELHKILQYNWWSFGMPPDSFTVQLYLILSHWGYTSPQQALEATSQAFPEHKDLCLRYIFAGWAKRDPKGMAQYYVEHKDEFKTAGALQQALGTWAETSPESAIRFLSSLLKDEEDQKAGMEAICKAIDALDSSRYKKLISLVPEKMLEDKDILNKLMDKWIEQDPTSASIWMEGLSPEQQEMLTDYKGVSGLPALASLIDEFRGGKEFHISQVEPYPQAVKVKALSMLLTDLSERTGTVEMIRWQKAHIPDEMMEHIMNCPDFKAGFMYGEGVDPRVFEKLLLELPSSGLPNDMLAGISSCYKWKFANRLPQEYLSFRINREGDTVSIWSGDILADWLHDEPEQAREWKEKLSLSDSDQELMERVLRFDKPSLFIPKENHEK